jgi:hypothetical protein
VSPGTHLVTRNVNVAVTFGGGTQAVVDFLERAPRLTEPQVTGVPPTRKRTSVPPRTRTRCAAIATRELKQQLISWERGVSKIKYRLTFGAFRRQVRSFRRRAARHPAESQTLLDFSTSLWSA